jgi:hypothetical protein
MHTTTSADTRSTPIRQRAPVPGLDPATERVTTQMSGPDLQELDEVRALSARGMQTGVLTYAEIAAAPAELGLEDREVEALHGVFERCEIELIEDIDPAAAAA